MSTPLRVKLADTMAGDANAPVLHRFEEGVLQTKALMRRAEGGLVQSVLDDECQAFAALLSASEAQAALTSFTQAAARRAAA